MMTKLVVRRAILDALKAHAPRVCDFEEIVRFFPALDHDQVRAELQQLQTWGYVENAYNAMAPRYRITAAGLTQANAETAALDEKIWGSLAL